MKPSACRYITLSAMLTSMSLSANQDGLNNSRITNQHSSHQIKSESSHRAYRNDQNASLYYLVNDSTAFSGDILSLSRRKFKATRDGVNSSGRFFFFADLLFLWDRSNRSYQFISVSAIDNGRWKSCWGETPASARSCDSNTDLVYIFSDEEAATAFQNNENTNTQEPPAMGPIESTNPAGEPVTADSTPTTESTGSNPDRENSQPESEPVEPQPELEPAPEEKQPGSEPEPTSEPPEPEPEPEPEPANSDDTEPPVAEAPQSVEDFAAVACGAPSNDLKAAILQATNESRAQARSCGAVSFSAASALAWNDSLARAAKKQSDDMSSNNFFSHSGSDGLQVWDRANAEGYEYRYIGENIAAGQRSVGEVQRGWINSPGHCANIMNQQIVEMGATCVVDPGSDYGTYWTVVVGQPQ